MTKFLVLYQSTVSAAEQMKHGTPAQAKAGMDAWMAWAGRTGKGLVDMGSPVAATAKVTPSGPGASQSQVGGYSILQAESKEALLQTLNNHPHFMAPGASIEVFEFLPMPGM
jgi:hypothetical protein